MQNLEIFQNEFKEVFPELFFIIATLVLLMYGTLYSTSAIKKYPILTKTIGWIGIQILAIEGLLMLKKPETEGIHMWNALITDEFTILIKIIIIISAIATIGISFDYANNQKINKNEWVTLILIGTLAALLLTSAFDLISIYLAVELQSLSFYVLAAYQRNNEFSTEAGLKYFVLGALSSGLLLFGTALIYGLTGLTNFEEITKIIMLTQENTWGGTIEETITTGTFQNTTIEHIDLIKIGLMFIIIAFLFKISAVPFHMWAPDVYEGAPTAITAFFAITPKIAILGVFVRTLYVFYDLIETWQNIIIISAVLSMFIGTFGAIKQKKIKRLIAYSGIAHVGYMLIGIGTGTIESIEAMLIYIIAYIAITITMFGILLSMAKEKIQGTMKWDIYGTNKWIYYKKITEDEKQKIAVTYKKYLEKGNPMADKYKEEQMMGLKDNIENTLNAIPKIKYIGEETKEKETEYTKHITDFSTLSKTNPILAMTMGIILFSNAGIPPLAGFYGKLNIFLAAIENGLYFIAIAGVICSVIGAFYSIRLIKIIWYHKMKEEKWKLYKPISKENGYIITITTFFTLLFFLAPSLIFITTHEAALSLCI
jgi:NADH-quinone oxidoreductase subunit N